MVAMSEIRNGTISEDDEFQARVDELLNSALQDQAREKRVLIETVHGAKAALTKAQEELTALRQLVDKRDTAVVDMLEARLAGLGTEQTLEEVASRLDALAKRPSANEAVAPVSVRIDSLATRIEQIGGALSKIDVWAPATELQKSVAAKLNDLVAPIDSLGLETARRIDALAEATSQSIALSNEVTSAGLSEISGQLSENVEQVGSSLQDLISQMQSRLASLEEAIAGDVDVAQEALSEHIGLTAKAVREDLSQMSRAVDERLALLREASVDSRELLGAEVDRIGTKLGAVIERMAAEMDASAQGLIAMTQASDARVFDRMQKVIEEFAGLNSRMSEVVADIDERLEEARNSQEIRSSAVAKHVESIREVVASGEETRNEHFARNLAEVTKALTQERTRLSEAIGEAIAPFVIEVSRMGERIRQTNRRITESNSRIEAFQESLISYLAERDQLLEEVRDKALFEVIEHVGEGLRSGERRKLADALKDAQERRADRRDASRFRMMRNHPSVKEPMVEGVRAAIDVQPPRLTSVPASELLAEVEAEMPSIKEETMAEPEKELLLDPAPKARPSSKTRPTNAKVKNTKKSDSAGKKPPQASSPRTGGARKRAV